MGRGSQVSVERQLGSIFDRLFYCPSCTTWRLPQQHKRIRLNGRNNKRHASTLTSSTAINATKPVPANLKPLYESLLDVRKNAPTHINTSRLHLALQGLESSNPTVRLAILGLNIPDTARRIACLLQADALEDEGSWEKQLVEGQDDYSKGLIIRYGQSGNTNVPRPRNSIPVLYVPAQILERRNIEILISSVQGTIQQETAQQFSTPSDTFLAPVIGVPTSFDGRQTIVSQPVHKCLLVAREFDELLTASQLLSSVKFNSPEDRDAISVAVDLSGIKVQSSGSKVFMVDTRSAEEGLAAIRESVSRATEYEHKWIDSGMPALSNWLVSSSSTEEAPAGELPQPIFNLISSVLKATDASIEASRLVSSIANAEHNLSIASRINLEEAVDTFSRSAHQELQSGLSSAWSSRNWRKLAWYKLFWRVDDVGLIITDLVTNSWLPKTERAAYELSGRLVQVGINPVLELETPVISESTPLIEPQTSALSHPTEPLLEPQLLASTSTSSSTITSLPPSIPETTSTSPLITTTQPQIMSTKLLPQPLTSLIPRTRSTTILNSITSLTTTSQQLLLRTLSITSLTGGLSLLVHLSSLSTSLYESCTILAVGTVFALWRMQGDWLKATRRLEGELHDKGRDVIVDVVDGMRNLIKKRAVVVEDESEVRSRERAIHAVMRASDELRKVNESNDGINHGGSSIKRN